MDENSEPQVFFFLAIVCQEIDFFTNNHEAISVGPDEYADKLSALNDHDKKMEKICKRNSKKQVERAQDSSEINFFKNMNAIDEEYNSTSTFQENKPSSMICFLHT